MSRRCLFVLIPAVLWAGLSWGAPAPQTRPWRLAVGGAFCTGYLGLLALHGFPWERVTEQDLANPATLKQYNIVFLGMRGLSGSSMWPALEQYMREGGIVVGETGVPLIKQLIPGRPIGPAPHPNIRFVDSGTAITAGLPQLGVIPCLSGQGVTVIPDANAKVTVLARFTDEDAPPKFRGHFTVGGQGAPAIMVADVGAGKFVYTAPSIAYNLSLRGRQFEPFVVNLIKTLSNGEVDDRLYTGTLERDELVTLPPEEEATVDYPRPSGDAVAPPAGFETLAEADELNDFALSGKLKAGATGEVLISYWSPTLNRKLTLGKGKALLQRQEGGAAATVATGNLPAGDLDVLIMRRFGALSVAANGQVVLSACDGVPQQGALAVQGLTDPSYQPLGQVFFEDDFMRESSTEAEWQQPMGKWQIMAAEGKPDMGANPFDFVGTAQDKALALNGAWFWSDYAYDASVKCAGKVAALVAHVRAPDNCLALRLTFEQDQPRLQLVAVKPAGAKVLAEAPVAAKHDDWQRLGLRTSGPVLEGLLDGRVVLQTQQHDSLCGQIGLYCEKGQANFDDIEVRPWTAASLAGNAVSRLMIVAGDWQANGEGLRASGSRGARAFPAWGESGGDCSAEVEVKVGQSAAAGLHFRYADAGAYYLMALMNENGKLRLRLYRHGAPGAILVEKPVAGDTSRWHKLQAEVRAGRLWAAVDGQPIIDVLDPGHRNGLVGLYARGSQPAVFRNFYAAQTEPDAQLVDAPTPSFAGIIDRHTWAGRSGAWRPDPADLNCFWHHGYLPEDFDCQVGLHPKDAPTARAILYLTRDQRKDSGYTLTVDRNWAADRVPLVLQRLGKVVVKADAPVKPGHPFAVGLVRLGMQLMMEVNHEPVAVFNDPSPLPNLDGLGLDQGGSPIF
ncbi:MAG: ThuA domain-containing protein, partial [Armatimonadetes bacterium]|nr:ThuA domain-containing protein [Armatimonadota bacterium]